MVYYLKYRPQTIEELDCVKLQEILYAVLLGKSIPHAFLFTGPKGLGKTSTARIVAKVVNCEHLQIPASHLQHPTSTLEPCNTCDQCVSITNGTNIDVLEIDGASNRGIDEIRNLREKVSLAPTKTKKKVYIIDEVHMLTTEAFNALLKTIEEPPEHAMFIFCTTEPHKVPATIVSRCFHISFILATEDEITHSLKRIVKGESLKIDPEALHMIAKMAEGGFRDATKILEEVVLLTKGQKITRKLFEQSYKTANILLYVFTFLEKLSAKNTKESLKVVSNIVNQGIDSKFFIHQVLSQLHGMLLRKMQIEEKNNTNPINLNFDINQISILVKLFNQASQDMKFAVISQLPLELAIIEYCSRDKNTDVIASEVKVVSSLDSHTSNLNLDSHSQKDNMTLLFENIIYKVKPYNHTTAGVLRGSKIKYMNNEEILFETAYKFHKERLEEKKTCEIIEKAVKEITGKALAVKVVLKK